jgi:hypothetical protein
MHFMLTKAQKEALRFIETRDVFIHSDGSAYVFGRVRHIQRRTINALFAKNLVKFDAIQHAKIVRS